MTKFEPTPQEEVGRISKELSSFGIKLLPPNLAKSEMDFCIEGNNIRYGLNSILKLDRNINKGAKKNPYASFFL